MRIAGLIVTGTVEFPKAGLEPGTAFTVQRRIHEIAVRDVVSIGVVPVLRRRALEGATPDRSTRIPILAIGALADTCRRSLSGTSCRFRAGRMSAPIRGVMSLKASTPGVSGKVIGCEWNMVGPGPSAVIAKGPAPCVVVPYCALHRQSSRRPLILSVEGVTPVRSEVSQLPIFMRERYRPGVVEGVIDAGVVVEQALVVDVSTRPDSRTSCCGRRSRTTPTRARHSARQNF